MVDDNIEVIEENETENKNESNGIVTTSTEIIEVNPLDPMVLDESMKKKDLENLLTSLYDKVKELEGELSNKSQTNQPRKYYESEEFKEIPKHIQKFTNDLAVLKAHAILDKSVFRDLNYVQKRIDTYQDIKDTWLKIISLLPTESRGYIGVPKKILYVFRESLKEINFKLESIDVFSRISVNRVADARRYISILLVTYDYIVGVRSGKGNEEKVGLEHALLGSGVPSTEIESNSGRFNWFRRNKKKKPAFDNNQIPSSTFTD